MYTYLYTYNLVEKGTEGVGYTHRLELPADRTYFEHLTEAPPSAISCHDIEPASLVE